MIIIIIIIWLINDSSFSQYKVYAYIRWGSLYWRGASNESVVIEDVDFQWFQALDLWEHYYFLTEFRGYQEEAFDLNRRWGVRWQVIYFRVSYDYQWKEATAGQQLPVVLIIYFRRRFKYAIYRTTRSNDIRRLWWIFFIFILVYKI